MSIVSEFEKQGSWLFRYRSFVPLLILPIFSVGLMQLHYLSHNHQINEDWQLICLLVSLLGFAVRVFTVGHVPAGTSGRNTQSQIATGLNTTGMYSIVRHPLYLGNYIIWLGLSMFFHEWWIIAIMSCLYALYYERIMFAEEDFLRERFGETFERWASRTPAILPSFSLWVSPDLPFSWRTIFRREYSGFFGIATGFFLFDTIGDSLVEGHLRIEFRWSALLLFALVIYLALRTLKRRTTVLRVEGR